MTGIRRLGQLITMLVLCVGLAACRGTRGRPIQFVYLALGEVMRPAMQPAWEPCP